jgi:hypothetical protein
MRGSIGNVVPVRSVIFVLDHGFDVSVREASRPKANRCASPTDFTAASESPVVSL